MNDEIGGVRFGCGVIAFDAGGFQVGGFGARHFEFDCSFLNCPDAHLAPAGDGHHFDVAGFCGVARLDLIFEPGEDLLEAKPRFTAKDYSAAEDAMLGGVLRGPELACRRGWAAGFRPLARLDSDLREEVILSVGYGEGGKFVERHERKWLGRGELLFGLK